LFWRLILLNDFLERLMVIEVPYNRVLWRVCIMKSFVLENFFRTKILKQKKAEAKYFYLPPLF